MSKFWPSLPLAALFLGCVFASGGCASHGIDNIDKVYELPKDLPIDLQNRFEVKDTPAAEVSPSPSPLPSPVAETRAEKKHHQKKKTKKAAPVDVVKALVYPSRRPDKDPIWVGEKGTYDITYFGVSAGDFTLEVMPFKAVEDRKVYHIRGIATSSTVFSLFYRLNDMVESFIDYDGIFSHRFHILLDETKQKRDSVELYDSAKKQTFFWNRWNHLSGKNWNFTETKTFAPIQPFSQDSISSLYYIRTVPLPDGAVVTFPVVSEADSWEAIVTVVRREIMDTPLGRVRCVVVQPEMKYKGLLKKSGGDSFIWLTDDDRRIVVRLEAKVKVGTIVASLKKWEPGTSPGNNP